MAWDNRFFRVSIRKILSSLLTVLFCVQQSMLLPVLADSTITGVTEHTVNGNPSISNSGTFNINPDFNSGNTGFKYYNSFNLGQGDIANLIFQLKNNGVNVENFVNLVNNQVVINGILNSVRNGSFYNGHAIFVSPSGMVIGASGVINVGSLTAISPNAVDYAKYAAMNLAGAPSSVQQQYSELINIPLDRNLVKISDYTNKALSSSDVNLQNLKAADQAGNIDVQGKIFARNNVSLTAKNVNVGSATKSDDVQTGIFTGVRNNSFNKDANGNELAMTSQDQAKALFNALVKNNINEGAAFGLDNEGNLEIKAVSVKKATLIAPTDKLNVNGVNYDLTQLIDSSGQILDQASLPSGVTQSDVINAITIAKNTYMPPDAIDKTSIDSSNLASVKVQNATLGANNIDIGATSRVDYLAQKGNSMFDQLKPSAVGGWLDKLIAGGNDYDYEGARAKATVDINDGAVLDAVNNVSLSSLAIANSALKLTSLMSPILDTSQELYYSVGTKTVSSVNVNNKATINAGGDLNVGAESKNAQFVQIENKTTGLGSAVGSAVHMPDVQIAILNATTEADTNAAVNSGSNIKANNVSIHAVNASNESNSTSANAMTDNNSGVAVAVTMNNSNINTTAKLDTTVDTNKQGTIDVTAQSLHVAANTAKAEVATDAPYSAKAINKIASKTGLDELIKKEIGSKIDTSTLQKSENLPDVGGAVLVNNSTVNTTAVLGKNTSVHAYKVNVNANTVDLNINNASSKVTDKKADNPAASQSGYTSNATKMTPSVAVIDNNQNNTTHAYIEDGTETNHANIITNNNLSINATSELPMNGATFEFILDLAKTGRDLYYGFGDTQKVAEGAAQDIMGNGDWDIKTLLQDLTDPAHAIMSDVSQVMPQLTLSGLKNVTSTLGLQGFFNNWAISSSSSGTSSGVGLAGAVVDSTISNDTLASVGNFAKINAWNVYVNAANQVVQNNAVGNVVEALKTGITGSSTQESGVGGNILIENVTSKADSKIGDSVDITATDGTVAVNSANSQSFLSMAVTGAQSGTGIALAGSVVAQTVDGETNSSIGKSKITTGDIIVNAGEASIGQATKSSDKLFHQNIFGDNDDNSFTTDYAVNTNTPEISSFLGIDESTGKLKLSDPKIIKDGISNIMITGATSRQNQSTTDGSQQSSSGAAVGASVGLSFFNRNVNASVADGADITATRDVSVIANSSTQSLNVALAGAFAGGVSLQKPGFFDKLGTKIKGAFSSIGSKITGMLGSGDDASLIQTSSTGAAPITVDGKSYNVKTVDGTQKYVASDGTVLKGADGKDAVYHGSLGDTKTTPQPSTNANMANAKTSGQNMSAALAGSINVQKNENTVTAKIGNLNSLKVGNSVKVSANQDTRSLNVSAGFSKAATVGGGAALNYIQNSNETTAQVGDNDTAGSTTIDYSDADNNSSHKLSVDAGENNDNLQIALGVGVADNKGGNSKPETISAGGSFNADILENKVKANVNKVTVENVTNPSSNNIAVDVDAENHSTSYKGAGAVNVSVPTADSKSVGAGMSANITVSNKLTDSEINSSTLHNTNDISVTANKDFTAPTENLISVGVAGSVITGGQSSYTFDGSLGTDVFTNTNTAKISSTTISNANNVQVLANDVINNSSINGAVDITLAGKGLGLGIGAVVNVVDNNINASIENSTISKSNTVAIDANDQEVLKFVAMNMGGSKSSTLNVNGIVNVLMSNVSAGLLTSNISDNSGTVDVGSAYNSTIAGITGAGALSVGDGYAVGGNLLSNILLTNNSATVEGSSVKAGDKMNVSASTDESLTVTPVALAVTTNGSGAAAANIAINVVKNNTTAKVDKDSNGTKSNITSKGLDVKAHDNTSSTTRGGTLAVSGSNAAVGGSIIGDIYLKNVSATLDNADISSSGDLNVSATAKNIFGQEDPGSITASALTSKITSGSYDASHDAAFYNWDMTYNLAGGKNVGVEASVISKNIVNTITSEIRSNVNVQKANAVNVIANNKTDISSIVGGVSVGGTAAVGATILSNVNVSNVSAIIDDNAKIGSENSKVASVDVDATSSETLRSILFLVGASNTAAIVGSLSDNIIANSTKAYIGKGSNVYTQGDVNVNASDALDIESLNLAVAGSGTAAIGGVGYVNVLANNVSSNIGKKDNDVESGNVVADGQVKVNASSNEDFQANVALVAGSGTASISGLAVANTDDTSVNAGIEEISVTSNYNKNVANADNSGIIVSATNGFNEKHKNQTTGLKGLRANEKISTGDISSSDLVPLVAILNISGAGDAGLTGSIVTNVVTTSINSYVIKSTLSAGNGLSVKANSTMTTYDAVMAVAGSAYASIAATGIENVYSGKTNAIVETSLVKTGDVNIDAENTFNLNSVIFSATGSGIGASITAINNTNVISNDVIATLADSTVEAANNVNVNANNNITINDIVAGGAGGGIGASVGVIPIINIFTGDTSASACHISINTGNILVGANNTIDTSSSVLGIVGNGVGASVSGYDLANVYDNSLAAWIGGLTTGKNVNSTKTSAISTINSFGYIVGGGVNGIGTSVIANGIEDVVKNRIDSYIENSVIKSGSVYTEAKQIANINDMETAISMNGIGNASALGVMVHLFTNSINSYIKDSEIRNAGEVSVAGSSEQNIASTDIGIAGSGTAATSANALVNDIEGNIHSYIDNSGNQINASGKISVTADNTLDLKNTIGLADVSGGGALGVIANVNIINNSAVAEIINTSALISGSEIDVASSSTLGLNIATASAAAGMDGLSGVIVVNSIGDKIDASGKDSSMNVSGSLDSVNQSTGRLTEIEYNRDGTPYIAPVSNLVSDDNSANRGTVASINNNQNIVATGTNGVKVSATNTLKNAKFTGNDLLKMGDADTAQITNANLTLGGLTAGASVLVTDMKYNTNAEIKLSTVKAQQGSVSVNSSNTVKANTNAISGTISAIGIAGDAAYFKNTAKTTSTIDSSTIESNNDVDVLSSSIDSIVTKAISGSIGLALAYVSIANSETDNTTTSDVKSSNIGKNSSVQNFNVKSSLASSVKSTMASGTAAGISVKALINNATSDGKVSSIVDGTSDIKSAKAAILSQNGGINATSNMYLGTLAFMSGAVNVQQAKASGTFSSKVLDTSKIDSSDTVLITAGLLTDTTNNDAGQISANVNALSGNVGYYTASVTNENANASASTDIETSVGSSINGTNGVTVLSKLVRSANAGSSETTLGAFNLGNTTLNSTVEGKSNIKTDGLLSGKRVDIAMDDVNHANTEMLSGNISFANASLFEANSTVNTNAQISTNNIYANDSNISLNLDKSANNVNSEKSLTIAGVGDTTISTNVTGDSGQTGVYLGGTVKGYDNPKLGTLNVNVNETASAQNEAISHTYGLVNGKKLSISNKIDSDVYNTIAGNISAYTFNFKTNLTREAKSNAGQDGVGLGSIGIMSLDSEIDNGSTTNFAGGMDVGALNINSNLTNAVKSYIYQNEKGLVALSNGSTDNNISNSVKNTVSFDSGANSINAETINSDGSVMVSTVSNAELYKNSSDYGMFAVSGGNLTNSMNAQSILNFNSGSIGTSNVDGSANFKVTNAAATPSKMIVDDHLGGFTTSGGAKLNNIINEESHINVNNGAVVKAKGLLNISMNTGAQGFEQSVSSNADSGFAYNKADSEVTANIKNYINLNSGLLQGKQVNIDIDSTNKLGAEAYVHTSHIFGQPSVYSKVTLNVDNNIVIGDGTGSLGDAKILATAENPNGVAVNINFMKNSSQDVKQCSDVWVQAAIATADYGGEIDFNTNNSLNIKTDGHVASSKDVNIFFNRGAENLDSYIHYKKISRILFGIPITKKGSWSSTKVCATNGAVIDGKIEAGAGASMTMKIDKDGNVVSSDTTIGQDSYKKEESTTSTMSKEDIQDEQNDIKSQITELSQELDALNKSQDANKERATTLQAQLDALNSELAVLNYINGLSSDKKMDINTFKNTLYNSILDTLKGLKYETTNSDGNKVVYTISDDTTLVNFAKNLVFDNDAGNVNPAFIAYFLSKVDSSAGNLNIASGADVGQVYNQQNQNDATGNASTVSDLTSFINGLNATKAVYAKAGTDAQGHAIYSTTAQSSEVVTMDSSLANTAKTALSDIKSNDLTVQTVTQNGKTFNLTSYSGKTIVDGTALDNINDAITSTQNEQAAIASAMDQATNNIASIAKKIVNAQSLYDNLESGNIGGTYKNGSYSFSNLNATGGTINIKSYNGSPSNVSGSGSLVINVADILINNYSNYNLVFKDLTVGAGSSGVFIDGTGYSGSSVGNKIRNDNLRVFTIGNGDNAGSITINNYYDPTHPVNNSAIGNIASDIIINGTVNTNSGNINILNEGGNIAINNNTDAQKITIDVPQGDFTQNTKGQNYLLKNGDTLFAGGKIDITASTIEVDGTMKAGNADRNLTITDDMLSHLVADYVTGKDNLVDLNQGNKSVYMNNNNNIKAIYDSDTNTVTLFGVNVKDNSTIKLTTTEQAQASHPMKLSAWEKAYFDFYHIKIPMVGAVNPLQIGQNAKISSADGNGKINIINNTNKNIVINGLSNNKVTGGVSYNDALNNSYDLASLVTNRTGAPQSILSHISTTAIANLAETNAANENIMIDTTGASGIQSGDLTVKGAITSGNVIDGSSDLTLKTNGNLDIQAKYENGNSGTQVPVINTSGTILISKTTSNGKVQIGGLVKNTKGNITVNNAGNSGVTLASTGEIDNTDGSVEINNTGETGINVAGKIDVSGNNSTVSLNNSNTGNSGISLSKDSEISNISQNSSNSVTLANNGTNGITVDGNITSEKGGILVSSASGTIDVQGDSNIELNKNNTLNSDNLTIENTATAKGVKISGKVTNGGKGDIIITNNGSEETNIASTGVVTSGENGGDINISKSQTGGITINGTVLNKKGNNSVVSNGTSGISISGNVTNKNGTNSIANNTGSIGIDISGTVSDENGSTTILNTGSKGVNIATTGVVTNANGDTIIENTQGTEGISIFGRITNAIGNIFAKNSKGDIKIAQGSTVENNANGSNTGNISIENNDGSNSVNIAGNVNNGGSGSTSITNNGASGISVSGNVTNKNGSTTITNNTGSNGINVSGTVENSNGLLTATNASGAVSISGSVKNSGGKLAVNNTGSGVSISGTVQNKTSGDVQIANSGADGIDVSGTVSNENGSTTISNTGSKGVNIATTGIVTNANGDTIIENTQGTEGISIFGRISNAIGNIFAKNSKGDIKIAQGSTVENNSNGSNTGNISIENNDGSNSVNIAGNVNNSGSGSTSITNNGATGISVSGNVTNKNGTILVSNITGTDGINLSGNVQNANNFIRIENTQGKNGINVSGNIENTNGATTIDNKNATNTSAVTFTTTAKVTNNNGKLTIKNVGTKTNGIVVNGLLKTVNSGDIEIDNQNSNIAIGENSSSNGIANSYITSATDTIINQTNGNVLNTTTGSGSYYDCANPNSAYKTLISTGRNLQLNVTDGDIGEYTGAGDPGFSINSATRNYTDSINVNVVGNIIASALNRNKSDLRLVNLRSRFSDMNVNSIKADGNVMLTASDWRQNDVPSTGDVNYGAGNYFVGYSILNAKGNNSSPNVEGENISLISSNNIGTNENNALNIKQNINPSRKNVWVSFEAENSASLNDFSVGNSNLWQAVTKHGSMNIVLGNGENSIIKSITSGDHLHLTKKGKNLTIYDLGISKDYANDFDDMLFHHDLITLSGAINRAVPKSIQIEVLDANGGNTPNSTLNIYNAYVKGRDANDNTMSDIKIINTPQKAADVELRADNVIAHAYNSTNASNVTNYSTSYSSGFNPTIGRTYYDNPIAQTGSIHEATGFHSYGEGGNSGAPITFDLRGVSPELVSRYTGDSTTRTYYDQPITRTLVVFSNPMAISSSNYKMKELTLSYNNDSQSTENRGMTIDRLYSDYGYVDTNDLNFNIEDAIINHYGEFRNGDRNASSISPRNYRWRTVVDNDYRRLVDNTFGTYTTLQLYTALTGSFGLKMGDLIVMKTQAPAVNYNPYEVTNLPRNENSFYRLTYKDDKIQETTTTPSFKDVDKSTDNHIKRVSMRFNADNVSLNDQKDVKVYNISKTGMELDNFSHAKVGDTVNLDVKVDNVNIKATAKVMRATPDGRIGVQFLNVDKATQNKILYLNLLTSTK